MNRNLRNELLTAIFVIAGILIAIGAILALSSSPDPATPNLTPTTVSMVESPVDNRPTATVPDMTAQLAPIDVDETERVASEIPLPLSITPILIDTIAPIRTATPVLLTQSPSNTPILPTRTPRLTNTPTPSDTAIPSTHTPTQTDTPTNTSIPPTQTRTPTHTPRPSSTPISPSATPTNTAIVADVLVAEGCLNPSIQITSPRPNDRVSAPFDVIGTATLPNFGLYRIEIRPHNALTYQRINAVQQVVYADVLAQIDPSDYPSGVYWIRLVVVDNRGAIAENGTCAIPTIFE